MKTAALSALYYRFLQVMAGTVKLSWAIALVAVIIICILKESPTHRKGYFFVLNKGWHIFHLTVSSALFLLLNGFLAVQLWRLAIARRTRKRWSKRRLFSFQSAMARAVVMDLILLAAIILNAMMLADPSQWCRQAWAVSVCSACEGFGWNSALLFMVIDAHGTVLIEVRGFQGVFTVQLLLPVSDMAIDLHASCNAHGTSAVLN